MARDKSSALADELRKLLKSEPFKPFAVQLEDGRVMKIAKKNVVFMPPGWTRLLVTRPPCLFDFVPLKDVKGIVEKPSRRVRKTK